MSLRDEVLQCCESPGKETKAGVVACFRFPSSISFFNGHFPDRPVVPGVVQVEMTRVIAEQVLDKPLAIAEIRSAKYLSAIVPDDLIDVCLTVKESDGEFQINGKLSVGETLTSKITLILRVPAAREA